jgi:hypothetical protein
MAVALSPSSLSLHQSPSGIWGPSVLGDKGLEKKIHEDETIVTAITMLQKSLTKNRKKILI